MKATLKFDLEQPQDREAHLRCTHSLDMVLAMSDISSVISHADENEEVTKEQLIEKIREVYNDLTFSVDELSS